MKIITKQIKHPILEITNDNVASKKVALKAGYRLVKNWNYFEIYEFDDNQSKSLK